MQLPTLTKKEVVIRKIYYEELISKRLRSGKNQRKQVKIVEKNNF
jgi:hypothetical protein